MDRHYDIVGVALLETLEAALGDELTLPFQEALTVAYTGVAGLMQSGAQRAKQAA